MKLEDVQEKRFDNSKDKSLKASDLLEVHETVKKMHQRIVPTAKKIEKIC